MTQPTRQDKPTSDTKATAPVRRMTSDEARRMYLAQLKKTNPGPKVRKVIAVLEGEASGSDSRPAKGRHRRLAG